MAYSLESSGSAFASMQTEFGPGAVSDWAVSDEALPQDCVPDCLRSLIAEINGHESSCVSPLHGNTNSFFSSPALPSKYPLASALHSTDSRPPPGFSSVALEFPQAAAPHASAFYAASSIHELRGAPQLGWEQSALLQQPLPPHHLDTASGLARDFELLLVRYLRALAPTRPTMQQVERQLPLRAYEVHSLREFVLSRPKAFLLTETDGLGLDPAYVAANPEEPLSSSHPPAQFCQSVEEARYQGALLEKLRPANGWFPLAKLEKEVPPAVYGLNHDTTLFQFLLLRPWLFEVRGQSVVIAQAIKGPASSPPPPPPPCHPDPIILPRPVAANSSAAPRSFTRRDGPNSSPSGSPPTGPSPLPSPPSGLRGYSSSPPAAPLQPPEFSLAPPTHHPKAPAPPRLRQDPSLMPMAPGGETLPSITTTSPPIPAPPTTAPSGPIIIPVPKSARTRKQRTPSQPLAPPCHPVSSEPLPLATVAQMTPAVSRILSITSDRRHLMNPPPPNPHLAPFPCPPGLQPPAPARNLLGVPHHNQVSNASTHCPPSPNAPGAHDSGLTTVGDVAAAAAAALPRVATGSGEDHLVGHELGVQPHGHLLSDYLVEEEELSEEQMALIELRRQQEAALYAQHAHLPPDERALAVQRVLEQQSYEEQQYLEHQMALITAEYSALAETDPLAAQEYLASFGVSLAPQQQYEHHDLHAHTNDYPAYPVRTAHGLATVQDAAAQHTTAPPGKTYRLFVGCLGPTTTAMHLKTVFTQFGAVVDAHVAPESRYSKPYGFVTFAHEHSLKRALAHHSASPIHLGRYKLFLNYNPRDTLMRPPPVFTALFPAPSSLPSASPTTASSRSGPTPKGRKGPAASSLPVDQKAAYLAALGTVEDAARAEATPGSEKAEAALVGGRGVSGGEVATSEAAQEVLREMVEARKLKEADRVATAFAKLAGLRGGREVSDSRWTKAVRFATDALGREAVLLACREAGADVEAV